jgi:hypothetical protein
MGSEDEVEQSNGRPCRQTNGTSKRTCELTSAGRASPPARRARRPAGRTSASIHLGDDAALFGEGWQRDNLLDRHLRCQFHLICRPCRTVLDERVDVIGTKNFRRRTDAVLGFTKARGRLANRRRTHHHRRPARPAPSTLSAVGGGGRCPSALQRRNYFPFLLNTRSFVRTWRVYPAGRVY